jgi:hypothetical protein
LYLLSIVGEFGWRFTIAGLCPAGQVGTPAAT